MTIVIVLFVLGVILLALEIVVPGAVLGSIGGMLMLGGVVAAFMNLGTIGGLVATIGALVLLGITFWVEMVWLPRSRVIAHLALGPAIDSVSQPPLAKESDVIGRDAVALSTLAPTGFVNVDGRRYEASCRSGYAAAGETLKVVGLDAFRLIVTKP